MSFKTNFGGFNGAFWWFDVLFEDRDKNCRIHQNYLVALIVHTTLKNSALTNKKIFIFIFAMYQNYPLALSWVYEAFLVCMIEYLWDDAWTVK